MSDAGARFAQLSKMKYREQAMWFANGFWDELFAAGELEKMWKYLQKFEALDEKRGVNGNELDEFWSHKFLEDFDKTLTAVKMREALRAIDQDSNGQMSLVEYCAWHYKKSIPSVADAPQGGDAEAIAAAQAKLDEVAAALADVQKQLEELRVAEAENAAAVAELKAQEEAYAARIAELQARSTDMSTGLVTRNKAANELAQLKAEDPLPLRKAKITAEAALRRVQRQLKAVEVAEAELLVKCQEAEAELTRIKQSGGMAHGTAWFMERALYEADYYLPTAKRRYDHSKPFQYQM